MPKLTVRPETWPIRGSFAISRGSRTAVEVVVAEVSHDGVRGRGECVPYARYGETIESVVAAIEGVRPALEAGLTREALQDRLVAGAARNALDCALWDLSAKQTGRPVWRDAGLAAAPEPVTTAYTLSLDSASAMGAAAAGQADRPLLKLKLAGPEDLDRVAAVHANAPNSCLVVDANEGWSLDQYLEFAPRLAELGVAMIEQPLPAGEDAPLGEIERPIPLCADESCHDRASLPALVGRYDLVNIKIDKTGGLTEALALKAAAEAAGFGIMVGCMLATSLAMAPALLVAQNVEVVDLDGPLLLSEDRDEGLIYEGSLIHPSQPALWG